jgi:hypothetical protein
LKLSTKAFCAGLPGDDDPDAEAAPVDGLIDRKSRGQRSFGSCGKAIGARVQRQSQKTRNCLSPDSKSPIPRDSDSNAAVERRVPLPGEEGP